MTRLFSLCFTRARLCMCELFPQNGFTRTRVWEGLGSRPGDPPPAGVGECFRLFAPGVREATGGTKYTFPGQKVENIPRERRC